MIVVRGPKAIEVFQKHMPQEAVEYCFELWVEFKFDFKISKKRQSKLGDYRYEPSKNRHTISVNENLNPYSFVITYVHEVAHLVTQLKYQNRVKAHGQEWKHGFKSLMLPLLTSEIFPDRLLRPLAVHMKSPKATSTSDPVLFKVLKAFDPPSSEILLEELEIGSKFLFNRKTYQKLEVRRTRVLCISIENGRKYLISETAPVRQFKNT